MATDLQLQGTLFQETHKEALQWIQRYKAIIACQQETFKEVIVPAAGRLAGPLANPSVVAKDLSKKWENALNETQKVILLSVCMHRS